VKKDGHVPFSLLALISLGVSTIPELCVVSKLKKKKVCYIANKLVKMGVLEIGSKSFIDSLGRRNRINNYILNPQYQGYKKWLDDLPPEEFREIYLDFSTRK
jgi:hypothetical protein